MKFGIAKEQSKNQLMETSGHSLAKSCNEFTVGFPFLKSSLSEINTWEPYPSFL